MKNNNSFSSLHPTVILIYFSVVMIIASTQMSIFMLIISALSFFLCSAYSCGAKAVKSNLLLILPLAAMSGAVNLLFNHGGATILTYWPSGNPLTLESIMYSVVIFVFVAALLNLFNYFNSVVSSEKIIYLIGRIAPTLALLVSMILRFVPQFQSRLKLALAVRMQIAGETQGIISKMKIGIATISGVITASLENSVNTADSMRSRGYGLAKRTAFSTYKYSRRDFAVTIISVLLAGTVFVGILSNSVSVIYFPKIKFAEFTPLSAVTYAAYTLFCSLPLIFNVKEEIKWHSLKSKI